MLFLPLYLAYHLGKWEYGLLKNYIYCPVSKAVANRPRSFSSNDDHSFVQDLDIGQVTGQFRYLYRGPYYKRYMKRIKDSGMNMLSITDRPAMSILKQFAKDGVYKDNKLIISNGGACVYELVNENETDPQKRYALIKSEKITEDATDEIRNVIETVSTSSGKSTPSGAMVINTKDSRALVLPRKLPLKTRLKVCFGLKRKNIPTEAEYLSAKTDARNISFEIFPKFTAELKVKKKSWSGHNIPYIGVNTNNLPTLRNLVWRHKNTLTDGFNQQEIIENVLTALVSKDSAQYINEGVCVTLSTKGLEFVPAGCSKMGALKEWCDDNIKQCMLSGDNFSDYFEPVSLKKLKEEYNKAKDNGEQISVLKTFLELSKPGAGLEYADIARMAFRYNVTTNSLSSILMTEKFATVAKKKDDQMLQQIQSEEKDLLNKQSEDQINKEYQEWVNAEGPKWRNLNLSGGEVQARKDEKMLELNSKLEEEKRKNEKKSEERQLTTQEKYDDNKHSGKSGKDVVDYATSFSAK